MSGSAARIMTAWSTPPRRTAASSAIPPTAGRPFGPRTGGVEAGQATRIARPATTRPVITEPIGSRRRAGLGVQPSRRAKARPIRTPKTSGGNARRRWSPRARTKATMPYGMSRRTSRDEATILRRAASIPTTYTTVSPARPQRDRTSAPPAVPRSRPTAITNSAFAVVVGPRGARSDVIRPATRAIPRASATASLRLETSDAATGSEEPGARDAGSIRATGRPSIAPPRRGRVFFVPATHGDQWHGRGFDLTSVSAAGHVRGPCR